MPQRPFRFGLVADASVRTAREWSQYAQMVEDIGIDILYLSDHIEARFSPLVGLTAAASATNRLRVGTLVLDNDFRHPILLAMEAATLDIASEGRLELGMGAGWKRSEYGAVGIRFDPPPTRVARLEEAIRVLRAAWEGRPFSFTGKHYDLKDVPALPRPTQRPGPPLLIGGGGPKMLSLAAHYADIVSIVPRTVRNGTQGIRDDDVNLESFRKKTAIVRTSGRNIELSTTIFGISLDGQTSDIAAQMRHGIGDRWEDLVRTPWAYRGSAASVADELCGFREEFGVSHFVGFAFNIEAFSAVASRLKGR